MNQTVLNCMTECTVHNWQGTTAFLTGQNTCNHVSQEKLVASLRNNLLFGGYRHVEKMLRTGIKGLNSSVVMTTYVMFSIRRDGKKVFADTCGKQLTVYYIQFDSLYVLIDMTVNMITGHKNYTSLILRTGIIFSYNVQLSPYLAGNFTSWLYVL